MFVAAAYRAVWDRLPIPPHRAGAAGAPGFDGGKIGSFGGCADQRADEPFSAATNRSEVPATPLSLRLGAPVSQRYRDVEDAQKVTVAASPTIISR
jgi:hypothetical protein